MNKKLLIVEDEKTLLKALRDKFMLEGYEVMTAVDGAVALEMALTTHPDLILLDIVMPVMDGMTFLKKIRQNEWGKDVPVVLLTNLNLADSVADALDRGVYDYLVKSDWSLDEVAEKVAQRLG